VNLLRTSSNLRAFTVVSLGLHVGLGALALSRHAPPSEAPAAHAAPTHSGEEPQAFFKGNTFEIPIDLPAAPLPEPDDSREAAEEPNPDALPRDVRGAPVAHARAKSRTTLTGERGPTGTGEGESPAGSVFGATGERASVDLATAFTRGFPQAASADPVWITAAYGSAGEATVVLEIDTSGALVDSRIEGSPSPAFRSGLLRTLALIRARQFTARTAVTRLHVAARVSPDEVHDGLHGEVFAIGGSFASAEGQAFFALAIGRRIDLRVRE
jgi:hypothetical protein